MTRICHVCNQEFPLTPEFWHRNRGGFQPVCKQCAKARAREWYHSHPEHAAKNHENSHAKRSALRAERRRAKELSYVAPTTRACNVCNQEFPLTPDFWHKQPKQKNGLSETCKECAKARSRSHYAANKAQHYEICKAYRASHPGLRKREYQNNKEKIRAAARAEYARNSEKFKRRAKAYSAAHPEKVRAQKKAAYWADLEKARAKKKKYYAEHTAQLIADAAAWKKKNPEKARADRVNYQARMRKAAGKITGLDIERMHTAQHGRCFYCGDPMDDLYEVDHYIPLKRGGTNCPDNVRLACGPCNHSKRHLTPDEFRKRRGPFALERKL